MWLSRFWQFLEDKNPRTNLLRKELILLSNELCDTNKEMVKLQKEYAKLNITTETANYWNDRWQKNRITYLVQNNLNMDVRNLIVNKSYILEKEVTHLIGKTDDEKVLEILKLIKKRLTYVSDQNKYNQPEYWQHPELTWQLKEGDCEDGALNIISSALIAGVPSYKIKLCAGWVNNDKKEGHAYVIYLADDDCWYTLDWCYFGNESIKNFKKLKHSKNDKYEEIWWTANDKYTWAQHNIMIK